jgi:hypothetical protein
LRFFKAFSVSGSIHVSGSFASLPERSERTDRGGIAVEG